MSTLDPVLQQRLNELKDSFRGQIGERIAALSEQMEWLRSAPEGECGNALAEILHLSHKLSGTASTFGFVEVGAAAEAIETACRRLEKQPDDLGSALLKEIEPLFETLTTIAATA